MEKPKITPDLIFILCLILIIVFPYLSLIGLNKDLLLGSLGGDVGNYLVAMRSQELDTLSRGQLPLWNPFVFCGEPRLAESQLFYPFSLMHLFLSIPLAVNFMLILHQVMAGIFMYFYARYITQDRFSSFIGAIVFSLSSLFMPRIFAGNITHVFAACWMPLLFLCVDKSIREKKNIFALLAGIILSLQILGGHTQIFFITLFALFLYAAYLSFNHYKAGLGRKEISRPFYIFLGLSFLGVGISAIQILPSWEFLRETLRFKNPFFNYAFSMPPENIITLIAPGFFGWIKTGFYWGKWFPWEVSHYAGLLPLLLAFLAVTKKDKRSWFFLGLLSLSLILSLGAYLPFYRYLFKYLVGFNLFRANGRFFTLGIFSLSILSALGCNELKNHDNKIIRRKLVFALCLGIILALVLLIFKLILEYSPTLEKKIFTFIISGDKLSTQAGFNFGLRFNFAIIHQIVGSSLANSIGILFACSLLFILYIKRLLNEDIRKLLIGCLVIADLLSFEVKYFSVFPLGKCYLDRKVAAFLKEHIGQCRYLPLGILNENIAVKDEIPSLGGYSVGVPKRYNEFINFSQGIPLDRPFIVSPIRKPSPLFSLLSLKYILSGRELKSDFSAYKQVYLDEELVIYENPKFVPRAFICHKTKLMTGRDAILKTLADSSFNPRETLILEEPHTLIPKVNLASEAEPEPIIAAYSVNKVVIEAGTKQAGYLVLSDNYYPGWQAYIDGKRAHIFRADYVLRAVFLEPGKHTIEFIYSPFPLKMGAFISLLFLILTAMLLRKELRMKGR